LAPEEVIVAAIEAVDADEDVDAEAATRARRRNGSL
jgi:hypothetical protein